MFLFIYPPYEKICFCCLRTTQAGPVSNSLLRFLESSITIKVKQLNVMCTARGERTLISARCQEECVELERI